MMKFLLAIAMMAMAYATAPALAGNDPFQQGEKILNKESDKGLVLVRVNPKTGEEVVFQTVVKSAELVGAKSAENPEVAKTQLLERTVAALDTSKTVEKYKGLNSGKLFSKAEDAPTQAWFYGGYGWWNPYIYVWGFTYTYTYTWYVSDYWGGYNWGWYRPRPIVYY